MDNARVIWFIGLPIQDGAAIFQFTRSYKWINVAMQELHTSIKLTPLDITYYSNQPSRQLSLGWLV